MMTLRIASVACVLMLFNGVSGTKDYEMEKYCDKEISMIMDGVHHGVLELDTDNLKPGVRCEVRIESWYSWPHLMVYFDEYDIDCKDGYLELLDGSTRKPLQGLSDKICGGTRPKGIYTTTSSNLTVRYTANRFVRTDESFTLVFTAYSTDGDCYEHRCTNGRCIHNEAKCSGYNSCGDNTDCKKGLSGAAVAGIVIGSLVGFGVLIGLLVFACCCLKARTSKQFWGHGNEASAMYVATPDSTSHGMAQPPPSFAQPSYGASGHIYTSAQQPAYPMNFQCPQPIQNPSAPLGPSAMMLDDPPSYSEACPTYTPESAAGKQDLPKPANENECSNATTVYVKEIESKGPEAAGAGSKHEPTEKGVYDNNVSLQDEK